MHYSGPPLFNPDTVLLLCVFMAVSAGMAGILSQSWLMIVANRIKEDEKKPAVKPPVSGPVAESHLVRSDSGTDVTDALDNLYEKFQKEGSDALCDEEIVSLVDGGKIASYALEKTLGDFTRAVKIRRVLICKLIIMF